MVVDTKKEKLCINQIIAKKTQEVDVEGDVIIPDVKPDILNSINTNGTVCIYKKEIMDGKVRLDGSINLYIMYMPDDENDCVRSINTSIDFTQIIDIDEARENMSMEDETIIKAIECKVLNGRKVNIKVKLSIDIKLYSDEFIEVISQLENMPDMQILNDKIEVNSLVGKGETKIFAKENISIDNVDEVAEIMKVDLNIINKDIKISYNKILAKAELNVKIMYLTEDNRINVAQSKIPVMGFVDIPNVSEENMCDTQYSIKNVVIKPNNNETKGIYIETQIELTCLSYEKKEINIIQDLYNPNKEVEFEKKEIKAMTGKEKIKDVMQINQEVQLPEIIGHKIYDVEVKPIIISQNILTDKIIYDGNIELKFMYESEKSAEIEIKIIEIPLNHTVEIKGINKQNNTKTEISVVSQDFIIGQNGTINCKINLNYEIDISKTTNLNIIDNLKMEDDSKQKNYSMIIYFVKPGDTLWKIAKKFKSTVDDIVEINNIENPNRISIGEQLFIPKYTNKKLA